MPRPTQEIWFLTGSQHLYGPEVIDQVAANAADIVRALDASAEVPVRVVAKPVLTETAAIRRALIDAESDDACVGVIAWMHTFSPAKMWITGLDHLRKPLLHLHTQANQALPWAEIDMDFMNLNQAAHGDREFGCGPDPPRHRPQDRGRSRRRPRGRRAGSASGPAPPSGARRCATMRLARFGDNMRNVAVTEGDKVEAERASASRSTPGASTTWSRSSTRWPTPTSTRSSTEYADTYDVAGRPAARRATGTSRCATAPASSWGCGPSSPTAASRRSPPTSRTSAACDSCRAWRSSG